MSSNTKRNQSNNTELIQNLFNQIRLKTTLSIGLKVF